MNIAKNLSLSAVTAGLMLVTGCTTLQTNSNLNATANTNQVGTNSEQGSDVDLSSGALAQEDTSDWLTYTNDDYGFSFKYPNGWEVKDTFEEKYSPEGTILSLGIRPRSMHEDSLYSFRITTNSLDSELNEVNKENDPIIELYGPQLATIGGETAYEFISYNTSNNHEADIYLIHKNDYTYIIAGSNDETDTNIYDVFLSTLKL